MTIQEMYQEMKEQQLEDILNGYSDLDIYDDNYTIVEIDYTTQEQYTVKYICDSSTTVHYHLILALIAAILHLFTRFLMLTDNQLDQLIDNYAERIVDDMDVKCLMQFVFDTIVENLRGKDEEEVLGEIAYVYDEDVIEELIEGVK